MEGTFQKWTACPDYDERHVRISKIAGMTGGVLVREVTFISEVLKLLEWFLL